jgi:hypothetical protein
LAKPKKLGTPSRKKTKVQQPRLPKNPPKKLRVAVGQPWHVEIARIHAKSQVRIATFLTVGLMILVFAEMLHAWLHGDDKQTTAITQFMLQGLSVVIGWTFGKTQTTKRG